jgi:hypothetical protein
MVVVAEAFVAHGGRSALVGVREDVRAAWRHRVGASPHILFEVKSCWDEG